MFIGYLFTEFLPKFAQITISISDSESMSNALTHTSPAAAAASHHHTIAK
jgi:hypothetical protein